MLDSSNPLFKDIWDENTQAAALALEGPILVIGASGFIGARLFHSLVQRRNDVFGLSQNVRTSWRMARLPDDILKKNLTQVDITQLPELRRLFAAIKPRTIFNLAAYGAYERQSDANLIHQVNYIGTLNLLTLAEEFGIAAFIQTGSSSEYGLNCKSPKEDSELVPNSHYAVSKVGAGYLVKYFGKIKNLPALNVRLYSIYGPWEDRDRLIARIVSLGLKGEYPAFANQETSRDFVFVDDCTAALVMAAIHLAQKEPGISLNLASGVKVTLEDIAKVAKSVFEIKAEPAFGTMVSRKWDLSQWYGDPALIHAKLNWKPTKTLEEGLRITAEWDKNLSSTSQLALSYKSSKKISAIIACYKDNQAIPIMHQRLTAVFQKISVDYEIIFVNDSSPLNDEEVIETLCKLDPHVIGVSHSRNFGSQSAFLSGMEVASGDAVVLLDGDLQDTPEIIEDFYAQWIKGFDVVYGVRIRREAPIYMQILYKVFYRIFKNLAEIQIPVDAGDFSLIDRRVVNHLLKLQEKDVFLRGLRAWLGFKQIGVPYHRPERLFGASTNSMLKNIWWAKKAIFSFSTKPLEYIQRFSVFVFLLSCAFAVFYLVNYFIDPPKDAHGVTTIVLLVLGLSAAQLFSISILGDYLGKVLEEVKSRPRFVKSKIFRMGETLNSDQQITAFIQNVSKRPY